MTFKKFLVVKTNTVMGIKKRKKGLKVTFKKKDIGKKT